MWGSSVSILLFSRKTRTDLSVGATEIGRVQIGDASASVLEQRLGDWHPVVACVAAEGGENSLRFFGLERITRTLLVLLKEPFRLESRSKVGLNTADRKVDIIWFTSTTHGLPHAGSDPRVDDDYHRMAHSRQPIPRRRLHGDGDRSGGGRSSASAGPHKWNRQNWGRNLLENSTLVAHHHLDCMEREWSPRT